MANNKKRAIKLAKKNPPKVITSHYNKGKLVKTTVRGKAEDVLDKYLIKITNPVVRPLIPVSPFPVSVTHDVVSHPSHYTDGKIEVIDFIEDKRLGFNLGNCVKYVSRAGKKDPSKLVEDLRKAAWYLNREIDNLGKSTQSDDEAIFQRWWTSKNRPAAINHFELAYSGINMSQFSASEAIIGKFKLKRSHVGQNWRVTEWPQ